MANTPTDEPGTGDQARGSTDQDPQEQIAAAFVTQAVTRFADETATWLKQSAADFTTCFEKALKPGYTANELVKDMGRMWAHNLDYLGRLAKVGVPEDRTSTTTQTSTSTSAGTGTSPPS